MQNLRLCGWVSALQLQRRNACMGGCIGGYVRPPPATTWPEQANEPLKRRTNRLLRGQSARSRQDWRMSSSNETADNRSALNSQALRQFARALSDCQNADFANLTNDCQVSFENRALANWHQQRREWVGSRKPQPRHLREPVIRWSATYAELLGTSRPFIEPVPLPEMVEFLVDVWEEEGLYG